jgi:hypothetical protein
MGSSELRPPVLAGTPLDPAPPEFDGTVWTGVIPVPAGSVAWAGMLALTGGSAWPGPPPGGVTSLPVPGAPAPPGEGLPPDGAPASEQVDDKTPNTKHTAALLRLIFIAASVA